MGKVALVTARDHHGRPVLRPDIGDGDDDINLPTAEDFIGVEITATQSTLIAARVDGVMTPRAPNRGDAFVDKEPLDIGILFATVTAQVVDPTGMIDQLFKRTPGLHTIVQLKARRAVVVAALGIAPPFTLL